MSLTPEVLDSIKPFGGEPTVPERLLSEGKAVQRVQTPYTTAIAVQKKRSIAGVVANVLEEAKLAGSSFYYGWTAKNKDGTTGKIEGPSIDLAMCLARNYGNCAVDVAEENETLTHFTLRGVFIDLESGFTCPRLFRQRKMQDTGMKDRDRQEDIVYQIGQSKAIRNAIVRAMPEWLIAKAIETAQKAELETIKQENPVMARARIIAIMKGYGVDLGRIEEKVGKKESEWTPEHLLELKGNITALREGRVTVLKLFPIPEEKQEKIDEKKRGRPEGSKNRPAGPPVTAPSSAIHVMLGYLVDVDREAYSWCPRDLDAGKQRIYTASFCAKCDARIGCPAWEAAP